ncbi:MAG TPA: class I SAM-dependent methyltransferase [Chloroflexia bacterium]|nr:class I SAM-dependent methyltransferase [Chloroflexia bacterium]
MRHELHEENRRAWNVATDAHNSHKHDQAAFFRAGGQTLFPEERALLGDIAGQTLVHLQCNAGQDTLSLARLGAVVTGVDISDTAIAFARQLAADSGIPATFHRADIYDWLAATAAGPQRFAIAFVSYGALVWLSDLRAWARGIAGVLAPGGRLVLVEFHPLLGVLADDWTLKYSYFGAGQARTWESGIGDYVAMSGAALAPSGYVAGVENFQNPHRSHEFQWGLGVVVTALLDAGLALTALHEYPYTNGARLLADMRELPGHRLIPPATLPDLPLMYGLVARKPG